MDENTNIPNSVDPLQPPEVTETPVPPANPMPVPLDMTQPTQAPQTPVAATPQAEVPSVGSESLRYDGVDASVTAYFVKNVWLIAICIVVTIILLYFTKTVYVI